MRLLRRRFLQLSAAAAAAPALPRLASAAIDYPTRPVKILSGFSAGGAVDIVARLIAQSLTDRFKSQFIVEDRPGAANNIATEDMVRSPPDGYMLLLTNPTNAINATLYPHLKFDFLRDSVPVAGIMRVPNVMAVPAQLPVKTIPEFIAYAKANAGKVYYASPGSGTSVMMSAELFKISAHVDLSAITYRGMNGGGYTDMLSGRVQVAFDNLPGSIGYIRNGQFRALGVTTTARSDELPDVPSISEVVPGYEASAFYGLSASKGTPAEIVDRLNKEVNAALVDPTMKGKLANLGGMMMPGTPADFGKFLANETDKWAKVVREANIKLME
ncbi:MAG TPA: tripartite tricarboxylate transporter substrate-binding protein [Xanthobacteraceae bacterium]|nr:tripartite tricarboxylate transporter substrate-binding protein [Xanthobacteraceae bacterium]